MRLNIDIYVRRYFRWHGGFVYDHWLIFLIIPCLLSAVAAYGFTYREMRNNGDGRLVFLPNDGPAVIEYNEMNRFFPFNPKDYRQGRDLESKLFIKIAISAKTGQLLDQEIAEEIANLADYIQELRVVSGRHNFSYEDVCLQENSHCFWNGQVYLLRDYDRLEEFFDLTYPKANLESHPRYIANVLGSVTLENGTHRVTSILATRLLYNLQETPAEMKELSMAWTNAVTNYIINYNSSLINVGIFHFKSIDHGLMEISYRVTPKFVLCVILLWFFSLTQTFEFYREKNPRNSRIKLDLITSQPSLAGAGILTAGLGVLTAFGWLMLTGIVSFNAVVAVSPFLVVSIGVDDMFLMLSAWRRSKIDNRSVRDRIAATMEMSAMSITITSVTNFLCFCIGASAPLYGVTIFCVYTGVAILFAYLYQITIFTVLLILCGKREHGRRNCFTYCKVDGQDKPRISNEPDRNIFGNFVGPILTSNLISSLSVVWYCLYLATSIFGVVTMQQGLTKENLVAKDFYVHKYFKIAYDHLDSKGLQAQILVRNPPDLRNATERQKFLDFVANFENTYRTMSSDATELFLRDYIKYLADIGLSSRQNSSEIWTERLYFWLIDGEGRDSFGGDVVWPKNALKPTAFRFRVGLRNFRDATDHSATAFFFRKICSAHPQYSALSYNYFWPFADQLESIGPVTLKNVALAMGVMALVALLMIPSVSTVFVISLSMLSIALGVTGFLSLWGVALDVISMTTLIMSIGFSVDLSAHISYAYATHTAATPQERVHSALAEVGWPVLQGALSTVLGISALAGIDAYIARIFYRTVVLVMLIGTAHAFVFIPVTLMFASRLLEACKKGWDMK